MTFFIGLQKTLNFPKRKKDPLSPNLKSNPRIWTVLSKVFNSGYHTMISYNIYDTDLNQQDMIYIVYQVGMNCESGERTK